MARVYFQTWGSKSPKSLNGYAVQQSCESAIDAVTRSIERRTGYYFGGGPRLEGRDDSQHTLMAAGPTAAIYSGTLCYGQGAVAYQIWFSIRK